MSKTLLSKPSFPKMFPTATWHAHRLLSPIGQWLQQHWFRLLIVGVLTLILLRKNVSFQLQLSHSAAEWLVPTEDHDPLLTADDTRPVSAMTGKKTDYVERFAAVARQEMKKYGIPASIKLAQGILETQAGRSPLATKANNHFGIKCFSRSCTKGHCTNFSDDSHKDFFRCYSNAWESYRAHSLLLAESDRYRHLFDLPVTDYRAWAAGLSSAGYATDQGYATKLVRLIEELELHRYDS